MTKDDDAKIHRPSRGKRSKHSQMDRPLDSKSKAATRLNLKKLVDDFLMSPVVLKKAGKRQRVTKYEAIIRQLHAKATSEKNLRASKVLCKYFKYGAGTGGQQVEVRFASKPEEPDEKL